MENSTDRLREIAGHISRVADQHQPLSRIEKDILLQMLREAYLTLLSVDVAGESEPEISREERVAPSDETVPVNEQPKEEPFVKQEEANEQEEPEEEPETIDEQLGEDEEVVEAEDDVPEGKIAEEEVVVIDDSRELIDYHESPDTVESPAFHQEIKREVEIRQAYTFSSEQIIEHREELPREDDVIQFLSHLQESHAVSQDEMAKEEDKIEELAGEEKSPSLDLFDTPVIPEETQENKEAVPHPESTRTVITNQVQVSLFTKEVSEEEKPRQRSLNDLLNEKKEDNSLNTKFQNAKIEDLTKSISINDKFLFIRELFKNRGEEFAQAIQLLNGCKDIEEAFEAMEKMKKHYFWDSTSQAYLTFCDLIRRKF